VNRRVPSEGSARGSDCKDAVIEMLAHSEADLLERVRRLEADKVTYRELAQAGIQALHQLTIERNRWRAQHRRLVEEYRQLRALRMRAPVAG
jgi:hypothetical protein